MFETNNRSTLTDILPEYAKHRVSNSYVIWNGQAHDCVITKRWIAKLALEHIKSSSEINPESQPYIDEAFTSRGWISLLRRYTFWLSLMGALTYFYVEFKIGWSDCSKDQHECIPTE